MNIKIETYQEKLNLLAEKYNNFEFKEDNRENRIAIKDLKESIDYLLKSFPDLKKPILKNYQ